ncbi:MAG: indole-3-glycerol phosphate synthase TrpC [Candidatus Aureabacteria bacterium]|nr:indole-3-glycerol phosphate synthase TrpC [Candidatus Auribacterota bacterium]
MGSSERGSRCLLDNIVAATREAVDNRKRRIPLRLISSLAAKNRTRDFYGALTRSCIAIIAEVKKASPSAGVLRRIYRPAAIARSYELAGAAAISVLTEERYFKGNLSHLGEVKRAVSVPVLRKDFIIDDYQIVESAAAGADAVLLIARLLAPGLLAEMVQRCHDLLICPLVEVHSGEEIAKAAASGARVIGVNNRDLDTLEADIGQTVRLKKMLPPECVVVSESGIRAASDINRLTRAGVTAFLIGEQFLRDADPGRALDRLLREI